MAVHNSPRFCAHSPGSGPARALPAPLPRLAAAAAAAAVAAAASPPGAKSMRGPLGTGLPGSLPRPPPDAKRGRLPPLPLALASPSAGGGVEAAGPAAAASGPAPPPDAAPATRLSRDLPTTRPDPEGARLMGGSGLGPGSIMADTSASDSASLTRRAVLRMSGISTRPERRGGGQGMHARVRGLRVQVVLTSV
ncbi:hypothetical protein TSOC_008967 [Tetrabaena socialis]|uniref:Uncharacterized protein n=1 Tax=Tetrabaena socialis TaxID=47790 RepID=A0A2J7ZXC7_9CHLO|nr:hypothetical protein TSOC_008967 [Tetrabaena socialis]|eukprot:PNH04908.1 hypothetical protein TSOC_008967 [Tetrabaena socialis]